MVKVKKRMLLLVLSSFFSCKNEQKKAINTNMNTVNKISKAAKKVQNYIKKDIVIAHRGTTFWAPEETEPAFLWARNIGADYLELDIQLTKDNQLVAFHDDDLSRTTNVKKVFPERSKSFINEFTLVELRSLDVGSWFNKVNPKEAKNSFKNLKILTLQDVILIAEGYRIKKKNGKPIKELIDGKWNGAYLHEIDLNDNGNRPGIYLETKHPKSNIEKFLSKELTNLGWNINTDPKQIKTQKGKVNIANTNARLILQSFSPESIVNLENELPNIPKCFLLWKPDMKGDLEAVYQKAIDFSIKNNVQIIGSSIAGKPNDYGELTEIWMAKMIHKSGLIIHPYTFDTQKQLTEYKNRVEGVFTNRTDLALEFYGRKSEKSSEEILVELGYK